MPLEKTVTNEHKALNREQLRKCVDEQLQHDLRNFQTAEEASLTAVHAFIDMGDLEKAEMYMEYYKKGKAGREKLESYRDALHKTGEIPYEPEVIGISSIVGDSVAVCKGMLENKDIKIDVYNGMDNEAYFMGDPARMLIVMVNLFTNMHSAMAEMEDAEISVTMKQIRINVHGMEMPYSQIVVRNNGPRLPYFNTEDAFELHSSGDGSEGQGLGLAICRSIVHKKFKGMIYARHPVEGGVDFYIELPRKVD
ncbi:ATP-binding protein [Nanoarchaeota archaeon]